MNLTDKVCQYVMTIPVGSVSTYKLVAEAIGSPKASRAVGTALKNNKCHYLSDNKLVPCHRVVNSKMKVGGFLGKTDITSDEVVSKIELLKSEGVEVDGKGVVTKFKIFKE